MYTTNRNLAIYDDLIIDTSVDEFVFALDARTGELVWETQVLDYRTHPANQSTGPIIANGKVISGRSCMPAAGPDACVITAHDARTGEELWRRRTIPRPGEPGDETWGGVPDEQRRHVGTWMAPSYDPQLNLLYIGTSVTSPAPKFMVGGAHSPAPVSQLDPRPRRRHRRDRLDLPGVTGRPNVYGAIRSPAA